MISAIFSLSGCMRPNGVSYELSQPDDRIVSIEIVEIKFSDYVECKEFDKIEVVKELEEDIWSQFLSDFRELEYYRYFNDPFWYISGTAFRITYEDGSFYLIDDSSVYYYEKSQEDGNYTNDFFLSEDFEVLERKYLSLL